MTYEVTPILDSGHADAFRRPYIVKVNGQTLMTKQLNPRRFADSISAAIAGAKHVDELKRSANSGDRNA
jgi:hypothetical protein